MNNWEDFSLNKIKDCYSTYCTNNLCLRYIIWCLNGFEIIIIFFNVDFVIYTVEIVMLYTGLSNATYSFPPTFILLC